MRNRCFLIGCGAALLCSGIVAQLLIWPVDGTAHGGWLRLMGRLHPLLVHFPIVLLLLWPVLEWVGRTNAPVKDGARVTLIVGVFATLISVLAGLALVRADGHEGPLLVRHLWGGIGLAGCTLLAWATRERWPRFYPIAVLSTVGVLGWTAHQGGSLTHGEAYLTDPLPPSLKSLLRISIPASSEHYAAKTVFGGFVRPLLDRRCMDCHGPEKQKGDYRMDSFLALLSGGKSGKVAVKPFAPDHSELMLRVQLPTMDDKVMPPKNKPRLRESEIALLRWWIETGAPRDTKIAEVNGAPREVAALLFIGAGSVSTEIDLLPVISRVGDYASLQGEINQLARDLEVKLNRTSNIPGDGFVLSTRGSENRFGDQQLSRLQRIAPFVVEARLGGTQLTDEGVIGFKAFGNLESLHLEGTQLTGTTLAQLGALPKLAYLNLCNTVVTDAAVEQLRSLSALRKLYIYGSRMTPAGRACLARLLPNCEIGPSGPPL